MDRAATILLTIFLASFIISQPAAAQAPEVSISEQRAHVHSGTYVEFEVVVKNNQNIADHFVMSVRGDGPAPVWWYNPGIFLVPVRPYSEETLTAGFYPMDAEEGEYSFLIIIASMSNPEYEDTERVTIAIKPPTLLNIESASLEDGKVKAVLEADADSGKELTVVFEATDPSGKVVAVHSKTAEVPEGKSTIEAEVPFPLSPPGEYVLRASVEGSADEASFTMAEVSDVDADTETTSTTLYEETVITYTNNGNVPEVVEAEESFVRSDYITGFVTAPVSCHEGPEERTCEYALVLSPGESQEIRYRKEFWPLYVQAGMGALFVIVLGVMVTGRYTTPRITKRYRKRGKTTSVVIGVKNTMTGTNGVIVRDWVSPLAAVANEGFEGAKPVIRRSDAGTELIWSLGGMGPREERMLSYKIRPVVSGNLKLRGASLRYRNSRGDARRIQSNPVLVE